MNAAGTYNVTLSVSGPAGEAQRKLAIICGDHKLALTPPMGWDAWNVYGEGVTAARVKTQADLLEKTGLAAHGYQYVIVDDTWQARRDPDGSIGPNRRFGNLQSLSDYLHGQGLKFGLYSSPTDQTCSGYTGSAGHEPQDAKLYASWGVDYLKYDWCDASSTPKTTTDDLLKAAFGRMRTALDGVDRDIVYAINPYGYGKPWTWGAAVGANSWWTSAQILDQWKDVRNNGFSQNELTSFSGPGRWNDPGWLMFGRVGYATPRFSHLALPEQMTQFSLWSLMAAPLIISCDLNQLDPNPFCRITTALLTNDEVIDVDQDELGQPARRVAGVGDMEVWARPLWDGAKAVGLFNTKSWTQSIQIQWSDLGLSGTQPVRDLWQHKDLGPFNGSFTALVPPHGVVLVKVGAGKG
ncbi:MAG: glycoside hydrolase family 27 protein, partial [Armatimonadota bacterium]|nr:glycoside hydrolase family 27 protein [Armatimonadota bacterium]